MFKRLVIFTTVLTFGLIMLGAYVRLSDAGLGCPDWPGCYGQLTPSHAADYIASAVLQQGGEHGPVSLPKAWKEMLHRYVATFLGFLICLIAWMAWRQRAQLRQPVGLSLALVGTVCLQGAFGAWTVTLLLKPAIVTGHLMGGMALLALLTWLVSRQFPPRLSEVTGFSLGPLRRWAVLGLVVLCIQVVLGGWVSTNYAALACPDFPTCQGQWLPAMEFEHAFHIIRALGETPDGALLAMPSLLAIHVVHRVWAIVVTLVLLRLSWLLWRQQGAVRRLGLLLALALLMQLGLGIANVLLQLPLSVAVLHNGGAALLLVILVGLNHRLSVYQNLARVRS